MKITVDELNLAYNEVNKFKLNGYPIRTSVEVELDRNPLTDKKYFSKEEEFKTKVKLKFELDNDLGPKGSYVLVSNVDIIDQI